MYHLFSLLFEMFYAAIDTQLHSFCIYYCCSFIGSRAIVSGPAGGVVGYAITTYHRETQLPVIGFDMGGMIYNNALKPIRYVDWI